MLHVKLFLNSHVDVLMLHVKDKSMTHVILIISPVNKWSPIPTEPAIVTSTTTKQPNTSTIEAAKGKGTPGYSDLIF